MVRAMSEYDFGILHLLYAVIPLISAGASFGLEHVLKRFQPEFLSQNREVTAARLVKFVGRARLGSNVLVLGLILAGWHVIAPFFKLEPYRPEFLLFSFLILLFFQMRVLEISLSSHMLHKYSVGSQALVAIVKLTSYGWFALHSELSLENAIISDTLAYGIGYIVMSIVHNRHCRTSIAAVPTPLSSAERKRLFRYGLFYNFNDAGTLTLNSKIDNFFIASILDPFAVGIYSFYSRLADMVRHILPTNMFINVVRPVFFSTSKDQSIDRIPRYFTLLLNTSLLVQIPLTAFATSFHEQIVLVVFGGKFISHSWLLPLVMLFATLNTIGAPIQLAAQYAERAAIVLISKIFGIYNIVALLALIPVLGVYGAALASGSGVLLKNLFIWWHVRRIARWKNWLSLMLAAFGFWASFYILAQIMKLSVPWSPITILSLGVVLWGVFVLAYIRSSALCQSDRKILAGVMHGRESNLLRLLGLTR
jgi:O-antigen/teichoic acid export membrane protein